MAKTPQPRSAHSSAPRGDQKLTLKGGDRVALLAASDCLNKHGATGAVKNYARVLLRIGKRADGDCIGVGAVQFD
jgi:hypothetical protein